MKVADIVRKDVISVAEDTPLKEVGRLIFSLGIAGVPIVRDKKLVGIVTEQDILSKLYPSIGDLIDDYAHAKNFENMEHNLINLLEVPVKEIMNPNVTAAALETPIMKAQSIMLLSKFSRLPIVDKDKNLVGIISQGDIFRQLLKDQMPQLEKERYASFVAKYYDLMVDWEKRFNYEFPTLFELFENENIKSVLDIGVWTGEYTIGIAKKKAIKILGLDHNSIMIKMADEKRERLSSDIRKNVSFMFTDYTNLPRKIDRQFDAAICMGNALPYIPTHPKDLFPQIALLLRKKNGVLVLQLLNFEKIVKEKKRLLYFGIQTSQQDDKEHLIIEFFDPGKEDSLLHNVVIFDSDGKNWIYKGTTTVPIHYLKQDDIEKFLKNAGFKQLFFSGNLGEYQGEYGELSFTESFEPSTSDWLNVVALR